MSAVLLCMPGRWVDVMWMLKVAVMNHRHLSRCITILSFDEPLLMAETRLWLSHYKCVCLCTSNGAQTAQLMIMGTNSFAIILIGAHSEPEAC